MVNRSVSSLKEQYLCVENVPEDARLVRDGLKNPFIILDFNGPAIPKPEEARIVAPHTLIDRFPEILPDVDIGWAVEMLERWRNPERDTSTIPVIALFPREGRGAWPIANTVIKFPLEGKQEAEPSEHQVGESARENRQFIHLEDPESILD
ncbi:hypothetical protein PQX77_018208 [Marasmius sp. AFHP31]|nr:hypothetical protein PQX77_018208 [Marasmius sp. AFHP31]